MKRWLYIFGVGFVLNILWENLHSVLYVQYQGGAITESILIRATLADACILLALFALAQLFDRKLRLPIIVAGGLIIAALIEWYALAHGRWAYAAGMPIIPLVHIGLTPAVQLAVTAILTYGIMHRFIKSPEYVRYD